MPFAAAPVPWHLLRHADALVSFDEHTIPRWTRKFHIGKGYVTTRNKYMRCEKLFTGFDLDSGRFLTVRGTPGNWACKNWPCRWSSRCLQQGRPRTLHALFDAGAGKSDAGVRALWDLAEQHRQPGRHAARLPLPAPAACLEATAQRLVRVGRGTRRVRRRPAEGSPPGRDATRSSRTRMRSKRCAPSSAGRSAPVPRRIAGIRCTRPARATRKTC